MNALKTELKHLIVEGLSLRGVDPAGIGDDEPLFEVGLELDSLDAVELVVLLKKKYGIDIRDREQGREAFQSVAALAAYVAAHREG